MITWGLFLTFQKKVHLKVEVEKNVYNDWPD